jgi:23S rRNA pseudouridine2605 synthase
MLSFLYDIIECGDFMERLQKYIAASGYTSRRKAEELICAGKVKVDGKIVRELGTKISGNETIEIEGTVLTKEDKVYYLLNKPRGVISSSLDKEGRKTVVDIIEEEKRIYPVGRLDYDTTGIMILTNDGDLALLLTHPKNSIEKVYVAKINGILNGEQVRKLKNGIVIDDRKTICKRIKTKKIDKENNTSIVEITICEGRNHIVKRIFESLGYDVMKLKREKIAFLDLKGLKSGEYRKLSIKEVKELYALSKMQKK